MKDLDVTPTDEELLLAANIVSRAYNQEGWFSDHERICLSVTATALESITHYPGF